MAEIKPDMAILAEWHTDTPLPLHGYFLPNVVLSVMSFAPATSTPASIAALTATLSTVSAKDLVTLR
jgi:hypothetical protein